MRLVFLFVSIVTCTACSTTHETRVVRAATPEQNAALLDRVKSLAGTWEGTTPDGTSGHTTFQVTSAGTAVREIIFPGTPMEMTNMYTMDGPDLLMTHYCAAGNQPHMKAAANAPGSNNNTIAFKSVGVSNLTKPDEMYMGEMTITFIDADHIRQHWQSLKSGKPSDDNLTVELTRRK